jgi:hypothetical protein
MIFLYSRKLQLGLLLVWLAGLAFLYAQVTGEQPPEPSKKPAPLVEAGPPKPPKQPEPPASTTPPPPPAPDPRPAADPVLNRCLGLRLDQAADTLILELDYVAAQKNGFSIEKARGYHYADAPTYVVTLGAPWVSDIGNASFPGPLPQVAGVSLVVSKSRNLRLLIQTKTPGAARGAKLSLAASDKGLRAEIHLPR